MRASPLVAALPALASAQQIPFLDDIKSVFNAATSSIAAYMPAAPTNIPIPNPVAAGSAMVAEGHLTRITTANYADVLKAGAATASPGLEEWMLFITGGNKTCFGTCGQAEVAFNESIALIEAVSRSPPQFGMLDCEEEGPLCNAWAVSPATLIHIMLPQPLPDQSIPATTVRSIHLNRTTITAPEIASYHLEEKYKEIPVYDGFWHPFDGPLAKSGLQIPVGYAIWGFSKIPSWAFMIGVSFISRTMMSRRMPGGGRPGGAGAAPAGGAPAS